MTQASRIKRLADNYRAADAPSVSHRHREALHEAIDKLDDCLSIARSNIADMLRKIDALQAENAAMQGGD